MKTDYLINNQKWWWWIDDVYATTMISVFPSCVIKQLCTWTDQA